MTLGRRSGRRPDARHEQKTSARGFDGDTGHVAADPDREIVTDTVVSVADAGVTASAEDLRSDRLRPRRPAPRTGPS